MVHLLPLAASVFAAWLSQPLTPQENGMSDVRPASGSSLEEEWAEEIAPRLSVGGGLSVGFELGRAPWQAGWRMTLAGATPHSAVALEIGTTGGDRLAQSARQVVLCDAEGRAVVEVREPVPFGLGVRFRARPAGGSFLTTGVISLPNAPVQPVVAPQRGDVVITEIMKDPSFVADTHGEWFEIQNVSNHVVNIAGWKITDLGTNAHTILNGVQAILLAPGQRFVLGNDADPLTNGGVGVNYKYSSFTLGNAADSILLTSRSGLLVDEVDYDDGIFWPDVAGKTLSLHPLANDAVANDDPANWCVGQTMMAAGNTDMGTPGLLNDLCP
ncbi:MAG TPA: lamin tail domain-containing protein [Planctomycetota bacterium]|nr:lamin tail domain-containing protein [Planctomycetota bacterium]